MEKKLALFLAGLVIGCLAGAGAMAALKFSPAELTVWKHYGAVKVGELLDTDILILKRGDVLIGQIVSESGDKLLFASGQATVEFRHDEIRQLDRNYYTRYLKAVL